MTAIIHATKSYHPPKGYRYCKLMSWGYTVETFLRPPPDFPFHKAVWAFIREDIPAILCDGDIQWFVLFTQWGLNPCLIERVVQVREWSRK